jgi:hypothetical protein
LLEVYLFLPVYISLFAVTFPKQSFFTCMIDNLFPHIFWVLNETLNSKHFVNYKADYELVFNCYGNTHIVLLTQLEVLTSKPTLLGHTSMAWVSQKYGF